MPRTLFSWGSLLPVAAVIAFFTSMVGVFGAFLLQPSPLSMLGITSSSASAAYRVFNLVAIPPGLWRYGGEGRRLWAAWTAAASIPGLLFGAGDAVGMYFGARAQKHVPARALERGLAPVRWALIVYYLL